MDNGPTFSQRVADKISSATMLVEFYLRLNQFRFQAETNKISTREFSEHILVFQNDRLFDDYAQRLLRLVIMSRPDRFSHQVLTSYLTKTQDEKLAWFYVDRFLSLKPDLERDISVWDDVAWRVKSAYAAIKIMGEDQLSQFCEVALKMFPHLPWGPSPEQGGLRGLLIKTRDEKRSGSSLGAGSVSLVRVKDGHLVPAERSPHGVIKDLRQSGFRKMSGRK